MQCARMSQQWLLDPDAARLDLMSIERCGRKQHYDHDYSFIYRLNERLKMYSTILCFSSGTLVKENLTTEAYSAILDNGVL